MLFFFGRSIILRYKWKFDVCLFSTKTFSWSDRKLWYVIVFVLAFVSRLNRKTWKDYIYVGMVVFVVALTKARKSIRTTLEYTTIWFEIFSPFAFSKRTQCFVIRFQWLEMHCLQHANDLHSRKCKCLRMLFLRKTANHVPTFGMLTEPFCFSYFFFLSLYLTQTYSDDVRSFHFKITVSAMPSHALCPVYFIYTLFSLISIVFDKL